MLKIGKQPLLPALLVKLLLVQLSLRRQRYLEDSRKQDNPFSVVVVPITMQQPLPLVHSGNLLSLQPQIPLLLLEGPALLDNRSHKLKLVLLAPLQAHLDNQHNHSNRPASLEVEVHQLSETMLINQRSERSAVVCIRPRFLFLASCTHFN